MGTARSRSGGLAETALPAARRRAHVRVRGTVQGVGFRPFVHRLATELELGGWVRNDDDGVVLEVEGAAEAVERFLDRLPADAPPLARLEAVEAADAAPRRERRFRILESERGGAPDSPVAPDTATCPACVAELLDPADRRFRHPFANCTDCGPRFTIVTGVPYDRRRTTMAGFAICERCRAEYEDPGDRRFHAQPNACPQCGPSLRLTDARGRELPDGDPDPIGAAARMLRDGAIVAVKGIGGYHLACLAADEHAVAELRRRKRREERPLALIAPDLARAAELVELDGATEELLCSAERPIVIARRRARAPVAAAVAPRSRELGVMLPYSPLHHLLLADVGASLVMTSGNACEEPIAYRDDDAFERLGSIADAFLTHDRPIRASVEDSVVRAPAPGGGAPALLIRRARGFVPAKLELPVGAEPAVLACGAELKSTFCLARGRDAWVGPHVGDLRSYETLRAFVAGVEHFSGLFAIEPAIVAHDLHPDYLSTRYALGREGLEPLAVQHHHAHLAACLAEHGREGDAVGAIFDGAGLGPDGTVWGGEILAGGLASFDRAGMLFRVPMPGGDAATREPWRMACAWLAAATETAEPAIPPALRGRVAQDDWRAVCALAASGLNSPSTSSVGRLFDAVAAICGLRAQVTYEGQAAAELESVCDQGERGAYPMPLGESADGAGGAATAIDARETVRALVADLEAGVGPELVAARFHNALAAATAAALAREAERRGLGAAVLGGGVFQNALLVARTAGRLREAGLEVLIARRLPVNDGGVAYGQAAVAAALSRQRR